MPRRIPSEKIQVPVRWAVTGSGSFPIDMLRYDSCWPATELDSNEISRTFAFDGSDRKFHIVIKARQELTIGRWRSFGWKVEGYFSDLGELIRVQL